MCTYCGTVSPVEVDLETGKVEELDLVRALRELPDEERGWQTERISVICRSCRAVTVFEPGRIGQSCEFCGSTELVDYDEVKAPIRPTGVLPFKIDASQARERAKTWLRSRWFAPGGLARKAAEGLHGLYLPYWTFDAQAFCRWTADSGTYYYTTETVPDGKGSVRTKQVRHVRWTPMRGLVEHRFDDELIAGTQGIDRGLLSRIEPFPTRELVGYDTAFLAGFVVEHYRVVLFDAFQEARKKMTDQLRMLCSRAVPGDTQRNLVIAPEFSDQTFKHVLVPVWTAAFRFRGKQYQLLVNGHTGEVAGRYPKSVAKILLALAAAAAVGLVIFFLAR